MKRLCAFVLVIAGLLGLSACNGRVPVEEKLMNYGDNSTVFMPVVKTGNIGLDEAVNSRLEGEITANFNKIRGDKKGTTTEGFTAFQSGDLLSVFQEGFFTEENKDGGESYLTTYHINIKNGNFYKLEDLFIKGSEDELVNRVRQTLDLVLGEYHMTYRPDLKATAFDVYDREIVFIFNPETVAPDHYGFIDAAIPFSQIDDLINKDSEFYKVICAGKNQ